MQQEWEDAARSGNVEGLDRLLAAGTDVDSKDAHGQTALMLAASEGHVGAVTLLAGRGANLDHSAKYHLTALMLAVIRRHEPVVRVLAAAGADTRLRGSGAPGFAGKTASDLARELEQPALAEWLDGIRDAGEQPE